jgi:hypothetical protein
MAIEWPLRHWFKQKNVTTETNDIGGVARSLVKKCGATFTRTGNTHGTIVAG